MTTKTEIMDQKRKRYRRAHVIWFAVFFIAWIIRSALKLFELDLPLLENMLLLILIISVAVQAFYALKDNMLAIELRKDPQLKEAMNDELVQLNELKAWKAAFFSLIGYIIFVALLSMFIDFNDLMSIFITALIIGFGTYNSAAFVLNR